MLNKSQLSDSLHKRRLGRKEALLLMLAVDADNPKKVRTIKKLGRYAGYTEIKKWNVSDILKTSKGLAIRLPEGWSLTSSVKHEGTLLEIHYNKCDAMGVEFLFLTNQ